MQKFLLAAILVALLAGLFGCGGGGGGDFANPPAQSGDDSFVVEGGTRSVNSLQIPANPIFALRGQPDSQLGVFTLEGQNQPIACQAWPEKDPISGKGQIVVQPKWSYSLRALLSGQSYQLCRDGQPVGPTLTVYADGRIGPPLQDCGLIYHYPLPGMVLMPSTWDGTVFASFQQTGTMTPVLKIQGQVSTEDELSRSVTPSEDRVILRKKVKQIEIGDYIATLSTGNDHQWSWKVQASNMDYTPPKLYASTNNGNFVEFKPGAGYQGLPNDGVVVQVGGMGSIFEVNCLTGDTGKTWVYPQTISKNAVVYQALSVEENNYVWWYGQLPTGSIWEFADYYTQYSDPMFRVSIGSQKLPTWIGPEIYAKGWADSAPFDREVGVPQDAKITVRQGVWAGDDTLKLRSNNNEVTCDKLVVGGDIILTPKQPLTPHSEYQIITETPWDWVANFTTQ